jgi:hypothetical protein
MNIILLIFFDGNQIFLTKIKKERKREIFTLHQPLQRGSWQYDPNHVDHLE